MRIEEMLRSENYNKHFRILSVSTGEYLSGGYAYYPSSWAIAGFILNKKSVYYSKDLVDKFSEFEAEEVTDG